MKSIFSHFVFGSPARFHLRFLLRSLIFAIAVPLFLCLLISGCNPVAQTTIGQEYHPGVTLSLAQSTVSVSSPTVVTGGTANVILTLRDTNGLPFISQLPLIMFQTQSGTTTGTFSLPVINNGLGVYSLIFTGVTAGTPTIIRVFVDGAPLASPYPTIQVVAGSYSLINSTLAVSAPTVNSGSSVLATLTVKDNSGVQLSGGGLTVGFSNSGGTSTGAFGTWADHNDGTYTVNFTGALAGTPTSLSATIQGSAITNALPSVTVLAAAAPTKIVFSTQPGGSVNTGVAFTVQPVVTLQDPLNNTVNTSTVISLTPWLTSDCATTPASGTLASASVAANAGVATFSALADNTVETIYLKASDGVHFACSSAQVNITSPTTTVNFSPLGSTSKTIPTSITATFSQVMQTTTLTPANFSVSCSALGAYTINSVTAAGNALSAAITLTQTVAPASAETCTLNLANAIRDISNNVLSGTATVAYTLDTVSPTVGFSPVSGIVTSIPSSISATFSKAMLAASVTNVANWSIGACTNAGAYTISSVTYNSGTRVATVSLSQSSAPVDGSVCTLTPQANSIFDTSGNSLTAATDILTVDSSSPSVLSFSPATSTKNAVPSVITATFSKAMQSTTVVNSTNWTMGCTGLGVFAISSVTYNSGTSVATVNIGQTVTPTNGEVCILTPNASAIRDNANVGLSGSTSVAYTLDTAAPTVSFTPATSVRSSIPASFTALFNKAMGTASTGATVNWSVSCAGSGVYTIASVALSTTTFSNDTAVITLSQTTAATNGAVCTLTASASILDSSGNALSGLRTSAITLNTISPNITAFSPATSTRNNIPASLTATFNDSLMNQTSVQNTANWGIACTVGGAYSVSGVSLSGTVATVALSQTTAAANGAVCTLTAATAIQNQAGTALAGTRTVAYTVDTTAPTVLTETPASAAIGIAVTSTIVAKFSKAMSSATLATTNFTVTAHGGSAVTGTVAVSTTTYANDTVTFTPSSSLSGNQQYDVSLSTSVTDSYGNALATTSWNFTTVSALSIVQTQVVTKGTATFTYVYPSTPTAGNMLLIYFNCRGCTVTLPTGFTSLYSNVTDTSNGRTTTTVGWHKVGVSESNSYPITFPSALTNSGFAAYEITGQSASPINAVNDVFYPNSSPVSTPSLIPSVVGTLAIGIVSTAYNSAVSMSQSGWTFDGYSTSGGNGGIVGAAHLNSLTTDTSTPISVTFGTAAFPFAFGVLIH